MDACSIYCSICLAEINIPPGDGISFSCQCFLCSKCFDKSKIYKNCPSCNSSEPDSVSLNERSIPDEIKNLIANPQNIYNTLNDLVSFQTSHYKSVIKAAQKQIADLKSIINNFDTNR